MSTQDARRRHGRNVQNSKRSSQIGGGRRVVTLAATVVIRVSLYVTVHALINVIINFRVESTFETLYTNQKMFGLSNIQRI